MTRSVGAASFFVLGAAWMVLLGYARHVVKRERVHQADVIEMTTRRHPANVERAA